MLKEIGSNFWLPQSCDHHTKLDSTFFNVTYEDDVFTSSGRSAIALVLSNINSQNRRALLPSFTCASVIEPFIQNGYQVFYYSLGDKLDIIENRFIQDFVEANPSVVLVHNYFGFNTCSQINLFIEEKKKNGTVIIEDITQALYSPYDRIMADYYVGSFRKWNGIPDGGFALKVKGDFKSKPEREDSILIAAKTTAMKAKADYIFQGIGEKQEFLKMFADAEKLLEEQTIVFRMAKKSYEVQASMDIDYLKERRRCNYMYLFNHMNSPKIDSLFPSLPDHVTPLYYPIRCHGKRKELQGWLRDNQIFAPIVWPKPKYIDATYGEAERFYEELLCIPCDQRYGTDEMELIIKCIEQF